MRVVKVQFYKTDKEYFFLPEFSAKPNDDIQVGDRVIVETVLGQDLGIITAWADFQPAVTAEAKEALDKNAIIQQQKISDIKPMLRQASEEDLKKVEDLKVNYPKYLKKCHELCEQHNLKEMKLIDVGESFDNGRLTFYFISDSRVDFRELVKDLVKTFRKKIRLQQIGVRDAARIKGDYGSCGLPLCCRSWLAIIGSVSPDYIKDQELSHRGVDRLTGICGRLKCCLRYEEEAYRYNLDKLPKVGEIIKTKAGKGTVVGVHAMKHTVRLDIDGAIVEYPYLEGNLCQSKEEPKKTE
jgi:cell fate regulator YaaT (PSP1 superfamily)